MISVLSAVAEIERENIRVQTMEGRMQKAREGKWNGGFAPYGYSLIDGKLEVNEEEAVAIRMIFDQYVNTDLGANGIAKYLENHGIHKIARQNGKNPLFDAALIRRIIQNPVYSGKISYGRRRTEKVRGTRNEYRQVKKDDYLLVDGLHEALVSEEVWELAQVKVAAQAKKYEKVNRDKREKIHLLSGILKCPVCGAGMYGNKSIKKRKDGSNYKDFYYYGCKHRNMTRGHKCDYKKQVHEEMLDASVAEVISKLVSNPKFSDLIRNKINMEVDTSALNQEIENYKIQLRKLYHNKDTILSDMDSLDYEDKHYQRRKTDLENHLYKTFDEKSYGIHSVRIYQFNRFIKQVRFCLLPEFKSDYFDNLKWLEDKANLKSESAKLTVRKVDGWQIDFANANVQDSLEKYEVRAPYREGTLNGTIISQQDNLRLAVEFELPICAYRYELISNNKISEKCDMADFLQGNQWLSVSFYGDYKKNTYVVELVSANGIEQREEIKLTSNGSANFDLNVFRDTLQAVPLPAKIRVVNVDREASFDVILIDEVIKFRYRPKYVRCKKGIAVKDEDINKNATLEKYGDNFKLPLIYGESQVNDKGARIFSIPENVTLTSGYYRIIRENNVDELFSVDDDFEVTLQSDQFFVTLRNPKDPINSFGEWLEQFLYDLIRFRGIKKIDELRMSESYRCRNSMGQFAKFGLSDNDIINLVLLGNILECKITKAHKTIVTETMAMVSELILTNEDRFRIIERLVEMKASDIVFNLCKENYCLVLLEIPDTVTGSYIKELASALKQVSVILALQVLLKGNVPIRETFGIAAYRDVIGQDAIIEMMTTNEREGKKTEDRKHFLLEDGVSCVHIALNSNISGINNFFEMADEKKLRTGRVYLDKNKIPEIGTYFAGTRYIDLFVNWYIRNHMGDTNNDSDLRKRMQLQFESFESKVWNKISSVRNSKADSFFKEFNSVLMERVANKSDISNMTSVHFTFPAYFYFEGIAALIAQLDEFNEFPEMKKEAVKFMVGSFQVAPFMSERDVLMAMSYIYLRRKERR